MKLVLSIILGVMLAAAALYLVKVVLLPRMFEQTENFIQGSNEKQHQTLEAKRIANTQRDEQKKLSELELLEYRKKEAAWVEYYVVPENCQSYDSDAHMVECINHKMRAKKVFEKLYTTNELSVDLKSSDGVN